MENKKAVFNIWNFLWFFIATSSGLFLFRQVIPVFNYLYVACIAILALKSVLEVCFMRRRVSRWPYLLKLTALVLLGQLTPELCIVTTASADILVVAMQIIRIRKLRVRFSVLSWKMLKYLAASITFVPIVLTVRHFIAFDGIRLITLRTALSVVICAFVYALVLLVTKDEILYALARSRK